MLIGLSLVHVGITDFGGGFGAKADGTFARWKIWVCIAGVADCIGFQLLEKSIAAYEWYRGRFDCRLYCCAVLGKVDFSAPHNLPLITCLFRLNMVLHLIGTRLSLPVRFSC